LGALFAASALGAGGFFWLRELGPSVRAVTVTRREIVEEVVVSGRVMPPARIDVGSQVSGVAKEVAVKEGDHLKPGDLLVALDAEEAEAAVVAAKAALEEARARLEELEHVTAPVARQAHLQADANLEAARLGYERAAALAKDGSIPAAQVDEAKRALDVAQAQHDATEAQAQGTGPRGAEHRVALASFARAAAAVAQAEVRVRQARITAATAATVLSRSVEPGELVQPGRTLFVLARDGDTMLTVAPDEKNLAALRIGQGAKASADAFAKDSFQAELSYIAPSVDPQRGTVEVRFAVPSPPPYLRPDMTVSVDVEVGRHAGALVLPKDAVQDLATKPYVWLLGAGRLERREIELGLRGDGYVEIARGVQEGDRVVVANGAALTDGQRVRASGG
jgi:HlyD family secretion protein